MNINVNLAAQTCVIKGTNQSMKILHVFDHSIPVQDGYSTRSRCIIQQQQAFGWETAHLTGPKQGEYTCSDETISDIHFYRSPNGKSILHKLPLIKQFGVISDIYNRLKEVVAIERPDIIHAHSPALNGVAAALVSKKTGIPFVYEIRAFWEDAAVDQGTNKEGDIRYKVTRALENWVVKRANAVFTICEGLKNDLVKRNVVKGPLTVIPNAVELGHFSQELPYPETLASKYELLKGRTLGFVGSFYEYEGLSLLINAMPKLLQWDPSIKLLLVGTGDEHQKLVSQCNELNLNNNVIFTGRIPYEQVTEYYAAIDLLIYPRKSMRLTELVTPLKPLEAMAQKKLFIASDVGGQKELVVDKKNGILFRADDTDDMISKIQSLLSNQSLQQTLLDEGLDFIKTERNWEVSVGGYKEVYQDIIS